MALATVKGGEIGAQTESEFVLTVTPPSGPPGATITVSGTGCPPDAIQPPPEAGEDHLEHAMVWFVDAEENQVSDFFNAPVAGADGNWSVQVVVPDVPLGTTLGITTLCTGDSAFGVGSSSFGVEAVQPPPQQSTTTTSSSTPAPASGSSSAPRTTTSVATAPAATPVQDTDPDFTG